MMTLGVTFDHRFMDGWHGGALAQLFRAFLEDPARFDEALVAPGAAATPLQQSRADGRVAPPPRGGGGRPGRPPVPGPAPPPPPTPPRPRRRGPPCARR